MSSVQKLDNNSIYFDNFDSSEAQKFMQNSFMQSMEDDENCDGMLKLFVGGLNYLSLQNDIKCYFETFGKVMNCTLLIDKASGKSRGFAFVSIDDMSKL
jgi:RNA recognition motif-containing protein